MNGVVGFGVKTQKNWHRLTCKGISAPKHNRLFDSKAESWQFFSPLRQLARLRRGTLTLEQLHLRVNSLASWAMPRPWSRATEICACDAFLTALDDDHLRRGIMMA
jgi:hypothetical protein